MSIHTVDHQIQTIFNACKINWIIRRVRHYPASRRGPRCLCTFIHHSAEFSAVQRNLTPHMVLYNNK